MIKKGILIFLVTAALIAPLAVSADTGIGIILGEPTGVSIKMNKFPVIGVGWSLDSHLDITLDMWLINKTLADPFDWYLGVGGKMMIQDSDTDPFGLTARVPIGIQWWPVSEIEVFAEVSPGLSVIPETDFNLGFGLGARYHF